jgi:hypothetical protein
MKKLNNFFQRRYRIVTDCYCGFEVQYLDWYFPFWLGCGVANTHYTIEQAKEYMNKLIEGDNKYRERRKFKSKVVYP